MLSIKHIHGGLKVLAVMLFALKATLLSAQTNSPLYWNIDRLEEVRTTPKYQILIEACVNKANEYAVAKPLSVTSKNKSFSSDPHDYSSLAVYWWPDETAPNGKYVNKDGYINPEYEQYDLPKLRELAVRMKYLAWAYYLTDQRKYYKAAVKQLKTWFVKKKTYMNPSLNYGQVIPGYNNNKGRGTGIIEAYEFNMVLESIRLLDSKKQLPKSLSKSLQEWFFQFSDWMAYSDLGVAASKGSSNTGLAYDVTLLNCALYSGNTAVADTISQNFYKKRIETQIKPDGSQPNELLRSNAYSYSVYNLTHVVDYCLIQQSLGNSFYAEHKERIDAAIIFLIHFIDNESAFKYQQIGDIKPSERELMKEVSRLRRIGCDIQVDEKIYKRFNPYVKIENVLQ